MIQTLDHHAVAQLLLKDSNADWSYEAAYALADFYEEWEEMNGPMEFDAAAIRAEWAEYGSICEALEDRGLDPEDSADLMAGHHGQVLLLDNGGLLLCEW